MVAIQHYTVPYSIEYNKAETKNIGTFGNLSLQSFIARCKFAIYFREMHIRLCPFSFYTKVEITIVPRISGCKFMTINK